jgi:hypothetical protein
MASAIKLKSAIKQLEAAMKSNAVSKENKAKFKTQLDKAKSDLASLSSPTPKKGVTKAKVLTTLQKLKGTIKSNKALSGYKNSDIDIEKDAKLPARELGRRVSKGLKANKYGSKAQNKGNVYYEYRLEHADVKQPPKKYPKLEDGGMMEDEGLFAKGGHMAKGGMIEEGDYVFVKPEKLNAEVVRMTGENVVVEFTNRRPEGGDKRGNYKIKDLKKISDGGEMAKGGKLFVNSYEDDKRLKALHQGKRISANGITYYENRLDHADVDRRRRLEDGGYMAKGGLIQHGLKQGDMIMGHSDNNVVVKDKSNKIYVININNGTRLSEEEFEKFSSREKTKFSKMSDGGEMAKGGKLFVNSYEDDKRLKALHQGKRISANGITYYENRLDHADVDRRRRLEHGGEMHRLEDSI